MPAPTSAKTINCGTTYLLKRERPISAQAYSTLEAKSRPKRTRLDRRNEIIGERRRKSKSIVRDVLERWKTPKARQQSAGRERHGLQPHLVPVQLAHFAAQIGDAID